MSLITNIFGFVLHIDRYISIILGKFGLLTYLVFFLIIFLETGLVITPFLPGDSLIFVIGAFAAQGFLNIFLLFIILCLAAVLGDSANYWVGSYFGEKVFANSKFFKKEYLERAKDFYKKYGGKTIIMARFVPVVRTFAPFVAGVGKMDYAKFLSYNIFGGVIWVGLFLFAGYFFGGISIIKENLTLVVYLIILISIIPPIIEYFRRRKKREV